MKDRIAVHLTAPGSLEDQVMAWQKKLSQDGKEFPLLPDVPSARDVLAWIGTLQEPIEIVQFHYGLVQYPKAGEKNPNPLSSENRFRIYRLIQQLLIVSKKRWKKLRRLSIKNKRLHGPHNKTLTNFLSFYARAKEKQSAFVTCAWD